MEPETREFAEDLLAFLKGQYEATKEDLIRVQDLDMDRVNMLRGGAYYCKQMIEELKRRLARVDAAFMEDDDD